MGNLNSYNSQEFQYVYDFYGNLTDIYEPSAGTAGKLRTRITYGGTGSRIVNVEKGNTYLTEKRTVQYDWYNNGAALWAQTDMDNGLTTVYEYDNGGRQTLVMESSGGIGLRGTWTEYDDANRTITVKSGLHTVGDNLLQTKTHYDKLGRVSLVQQSDGSALTGNPNDGIKISTTETTPTGGRMVLTTTPYRTTSDTTFEWSCTQYDTLGRVRLVSTFKGSVQPVNCVSTTNRTGATYMSYDSADETTITDPAGKQRKQRVDSLGRLVEIAEDPSGLNYITTYTYDVMDNLTQVVQGSQTRTFAYSSLSRLLSAANPESGTTGYTYHSSGDLATKTDARNITSTIAYDIYRRIITKTYSDTTPNVTYTYYTSSAPNIGRLKSVEAANVATNSYIYDSLGRVTNNTHTITGAGTKAFSYGWYLNGALAQQTYPSGKVVNYGVDNAGRTTMVSSGVTNYVSGAGHAPDGRIEGLIYGNGLIETRDYNVPGIPTVYRLGTFPYGGNVTQLEYDFAATTNNGNVQAQRTIRNGTTWSQSYGYDGVNRLSSASEAGGWSRTYGYDRYGNRWLASSTGLANFAWEPTLQSDFNQANNRLVLAQLTFDSVGNQTMLPDSSFVPAPITLAYDAESRITMVGVPGGPPNLITYAYDGEGRRVKKTSGGVTTYYVYNALGQMAAEYSTQAPVETGISYLFTDMLGSVRTITNASGNITECYDYMPFGRILSASDNGRTAAGCHPANPNDLTGTSSTEKFTGQKRDETGLDYFGARYMSSPLGRFTSTDPLNIPNLQQLNPGLFSKVIANPQNWNGYSYSHNNPLNRMDPDGYLTIIVPGTRNNHDEWEEDEFRKLVEKTFGEQAIVLDNHKMGNDKKSRKEAANKINDIIKNHEFAEGEQLNIVAHSHGGNAVFEATRSGMDHKIDNLVTMGTPIRNDYIPDFSKVDNFLNVFSRNDSIQPLGSGLTLGARRMFFNPSVKNLDATGAGKPGHFELWQKPDTWNLIIEPKLKK